MPGATLAAKLQWIKDNAANDTHYIVEVNADEAIAPHDMSYDGKTGIKITIRGMTSERTVSLTQNGILFNVMQDVQLTLDNRITLSGGGSNNNTLVRVIQNAKFIMKDGSKITNNRHRGVTLSGANTSFVMDGGEISNNTVTNNAGGGVFIWRGAFVMNGGLITKNISNSALGHPSGGGGVMLDSEPASFTMNGGTISENAVTGGNTSTGGANGSGGGVGLSGGTFTMTGGNIIKNTTVGEGGGVNVLTSTFIMSGGTIAGNSARQGGGVHIRGNTFEKKNEGGIIYGSDGGDNANTVTVPTNPANAVYVWGSGGVHRVTTVEANERLYYHHASGGSMTTEGNWIQN